MQPKFSFLLLLIVSISAIAQKQNDVVTPLHALQPDYPVQYTLPTKESVKKILDGIYTYLDAVTPAQFVDRTNNKVFDKVDHPDTNVDF